jgi:hypothetical protein
MAFKSTDFSRIGVASISWSTASAASIHGSDYFIDGGTMPTI